MILLESKISKIISLTILCILFGGIFSLIGLGLASIIWGIPFHEISTVFQDIQNNEYSGIIKFLQLFNSLGLFVIPGIVFTLLFLPNKFKSLGLKNSTPLINFGFIILLFFTLIPVINFTMKLNEAVQLPELFAEIEQWMKNAEESAKQMTIAFLKMDKPSDLLINIFLIGVIPAFGEELIFRGLLQRIINANNFNYHIGIWVSAILFSAIHAQFYGFLPRMLLGAFFGYLLVWSGSLWLPIFAHFLNNTTGVIAAYYYGNTNLETELDTIGTGEGTEYFTLISFIIFLSLLFSFKKEQKKSRLKSGI